MERSMKNDFPITLQGNILFQYTFTNIGQHILCTELQLVPPLYENNKQHDRLSSKKKNSLSEEWIQLNIKPL